MDLMREVEPVLAAWWHTHFEQDTFMLPAHVRHQLDAALNAMRNGMAPPLRQSGGLVELQVAAELLRRLANGELAVHLADEFALSRQPVSCDWEPAVTAWLRRDWPAVAAWMEWSRSRRRGNELIQLRKARQERDCLVRSFR